MSSNCDASFELMKAASGNRFVLTDATLMPSTTEMRLAFVRSCRALDCITAFSDILIVRFDITNYWSTDPTEAHPYFTNDLARRRIHGRDLPVRKDNLI